MLELKTVFNMKGNFGRKRRLSVFVVTGNSNGLGGFATGKGIESKTALRKAKNRAGQKLMHVNIFRGHTGNLIEVKTLSKLVLKIIFVVYHDFFTQFGATKIFVSQRPPGYGLRCHRAIKTICEVVGIKDLYAKVEGSTNVQHVVKAFFLGLLRQVIYQKHNISVSILIDLCYLQKTHQQIAEDKQLHLVELCKENLNFPNVLASPASVRTSDKLQHDETLDFTQYCLDGRVILQRKKFPPFYTKQKGWETYLKKQEIIRNQDKVKRNLIAEYGEIRSFLTDKYPECRPNKMQKEAAAEENADEGS